LVGFLQIEIQTFVISMINPDVNIDKILERRRTATSDRTQTVGPHCYDLVL